MNASVRLPACLVCLALTLSACGGGGGGGGDNGEVARQPSTVHAAAVVEPGPECPNGGVSVDSGIDDNGNGTLDPAEVDSTEVICNGEDGLASLLALTDVPPGADCANGGTRIQSGVDVDGNGVLDAGEVTTEAFVCRPEPASAFDGLVYLADAEVDREEALFATTRDGARVTKIAGLPRAGVGLQIPTDDRRAPRLSPDRSKLAFVLDLGAESFIYVADLLAGGAPQQASGPVARAVLEYSWSPNSDRLLYRARDEGTALAPIGVYTVLADGTLERQILADRAVGGLSWSPDGSLITYVSDRNTANEQELYVNNPNGNGEVHLSAPLAAGDDVLVFDKGVQWAPDGSRVAYLARIAPDSQDQLFTVSSDGTGHQLVSNPAMIDAGDVLQTYRWAPDASRIAYLADETVNEQFGLFTTDPVTGVRQILAPFVTSARGLVDGLGGDDPTMIAWSPDSSEIAFVAERITADVFELFVAAADGSAINLVSGTMVENGDIGGNNANISEPTFAWSPDSSLIAFRADAVVNNLTQLFLVSRNGGTVTPASLNSGSVINDVFDFAWSPNGAWLAYLAAEDVDGAVELYAVDPGLTARHKLSTPASGSNEDVLNGIRWLPDSSLVAFRADRDPSSNQVVELFTAGIDVPATRVSGDLVENGDVDLFLVD
jgi:Tol biopolymer transport system component